MKKTLAVLLMVVMSLALMTGCSDPVYDDFENYLNIQMVDVNDNYVKITEEAANWENYEEDAEFVSSINDIMLPLVDDSLAKLDKINPQTDEVKDLKVKYVKVMDAYKAGFEEVAEGFASEDADMIEAGNEKINEAIEFLDEYNAALEALAEQVGAEIEY